MSLHAPNRKNAPYMARFSCLAASHCSISRRNVRWGSFDHPHPQSCRNTREGASMPSRSPPCCVSTRRWSFRPTPPLHCVERCEGRLLDHPRPSVVSFDVMVGFQTYPAPLLRRDAKQRASMPSRSPPFHVSTLRWAIWPSVRLKCGMGGLV